MTSEHNPIALIVDELQDQWITTISPRKQAKLIRWLMKPEEVRICESVLRLENSAHGKTPDGVHLLFTPFDHPYKYSYQLIQHFAGSFETDPASAAELPEKKNLLPGWNPLPFVKAAHRAPDDCNGIFLQMLRAYQQALPDQQMRLIVALLPQSLTNPRHMKLWLEDMLAQVIPDHITLLVVDHAGHPSYGRLRNKLGHEVLDFSVPVDVEGALQKMITAGAATHPEMAFPALLLQMGEATAAGKEQELDKLAAQALALGQRQQNFGMMATAFIVHAGYIFSFRKLDKMGQLLEQGRKYVRKGLEKADPACPALDVQYYGYDYIVAYHTKNFAKALQALQLQGDAATAHNFPLQAVSAWLRAAELAKKQEPRSYTSLLEKAYATGIQLNESERGFSDLLFAAAHLYRYYTAKDNPLRAKEINVEMIGLYGRGWQQQAEDKISHFRQQAQLEQQRLQQAPTA
jgi:hypothetical protein